MQKNKYSYDDAAAQLTGDASARAHGADICGGRAMAIAMA